MSIIYIDPYQFAAAAGPTDPYFSNVSLLLHGDGANGSTTIVDSSSSPKTFTIYGNAQISTAQSKSGGSSLYFDGVNSAIVASSSPSFLFETGDFTIECFAWQDETATGVGNIFNQRTGGSGVTFRTQNRYVHFFYGDGFGFASTPSQMPASQFNHVALTRHGDIVTIWVNGVNSASVNVGSTSITGASTPWIGSYFGLPATEVFKGYIDELRVTKGIARYTANFTPPTAPFPDA